jgi:hypothetical protein
VVYFGRGGCGQDSRYGGFDMTIRLRRWVTLGLLFWATAWLATCERPAYAQATRPVTQADVDQSIADLTGSLLRSGDRKDLASRIPIAEPIGRSPQRAKGDKKAKTRYRTFRRARGR